MLITKRIIKKIQRESIKSCNYRMTKSKIVYSNERKRLFRSSPTRYILNLWYEIENTVPKTKKGKGLVSGRLKSKWTMKLWGYFNLVTLLGLLISKNMRLLNKGKGLPSKINIPLISSINHLIPFSPTIHIFAKKSTK